MPPRATAATSGPKKKNEMKLFLVTCKEKWQTLGCYCEQPDKTLTGSQKSLWPWSSCNATRRGGERIITAAGVAGDDHLSVSTTKYASNGKFPDWNGWAVISNHGAAA